MSKHIKVQGKSVHFAVQGALMLLFVLFFTMKSEVLLAQQNIPSKSWALNVQLTPTLSLLKSDVYNNERKVSCGFVGGLNAAYYFKTFDKFSMAFSAGLNFSNYNSNHKLNYIDSVWTVDADQDRVHVYEQCDNMKEKQTISYIDIPLLLYFDYVLASKLEAFVNVGCSFSVATIKNSYYTESILTRKGYYPDYNVLIYDVDVPNSQYFYPTDKHISNKGVLDVKNNISLISAIGVRYRVSSKIALSLGLNSFFGVKNISNYKNNSGSTLVNNDHTVNTLFHNSEKIRVSAHGLSVGVSLFF